MAPAFDTFALRRRLMKSTLGTLLLVAAASAAQAGDKFPKCFSADREGHCVTAQVNGQTTVRMTKKTKKLLEAANRGSLNFENCDVRYEVPLPIRGDLDVRYDWKPEAAAYFGAPPDVQVNVYPLEGQTLETHAEISTAPSVRAGGSAVVTQADVIEGNRLPPGKYVLTSRVSGKVQNWDCHSFFVQVTE
jgi:hypothetical protein